MTNTMNEREKALWDAKAFWEGKPDPKDAPEGTYVCDACGGPIRDKHGTSLIGGWMRCTNCTDRKFPVQETSDDFYFRKSNSSAMDKKVEQQVCIKCNKKFNQEDTTCPHCGHSHWGVHIGLIIAGLVLVPLAIFFTIHSIDSDGIVMNKLIFFLSIIGGFLGVIMLFGGFVSIKNALKIRNRLKKGMDTL